MRTYIPENEEVAVAELLHHKMNEIDILEICLQDKSIKLQLVGLIIKYFGHDFTMIRNVGSSLIDLPLACVQLWSQ